jgi:hypothetical protein
MIGFETVGNATVVCYDDDPILVTDPWISGDAYFGGWCLPYEIPKSSLENIKRAKYIWLSHGHPDHLSSLSLHDLAGTKLLLPDHVGGRIYQGLSEKGFNCTILEDRKWIPLSNNIKVLCVADYNQDAILLIDINGRLIININDANPRGWSDFVRSIAKNYEDPILLKTFGYGDVDMINFFTEDGKRITPPAAQKKPLGAEIQKWAEYFGAKTVIPFSSFHAQQRADNIWASEYSTPLTAYSEGLNMEKARLLPAFIRYDCSLDRAEELKPAQKEIQIHDPKEFGDDWNETLEKEEEKQLLEYFKNMEFLKDTIDYVRFKVGGREHVIEFTKGKHNRGLTFETPRGSLMTCVRYEIFDDLLIANFTKTTLHGAWNIVDLSRYFTPYVTKYADNGTAKTPQALKRYFHEYYKRAPLEYLKHQFERGSALKFRGFVGVNSPLYGAVKKTYFFLKQRGF